MNPRPLVLEPYAWLHIVLDMNATMQELYSMSLHDTDPRVAAVASWGLAAACHAQKHRPHSKGAPTGGPTWGPSGLAQADVETSKLSAQLKTLTGIPPDGAMRALVEIVVQGQLQSCSYCRSAVV